MTPIRCASGSQSEASTSSCPIERPVGTAATKTAESSEGTNAAGSSNEPTPGSASSADSSYVMRTSSLPTEPSSTSPASGSPSGNVYETRSREIAPEQRWILHGRLTDYSAAEVLSNWYTSKERESVGPRVVDLDGVSSIDKSGERVLSMMIQDGARFGGIYARHLLAALQESAESNSQPN